MAPFAHELDVGDGGSVERFFEASEAAFGTVTAVINNAATPALRAAPGLQPGETSPLKSAPN